MTLPTWPEWKLYDWRRCTACGTGLLVEVRANEDGKIMYHTECLRCHDTDHGIVREGA